MHLQRVRQHHQKRWHKPTSTHIPIQPWANATGGAGGYNSTTFAAWRRAAGGKDTTATRTVYTYTAAAVAMLTRTTSRTPRIRVSLQIEKMFWWQVKANTSSGVTRASVSRGVARHHSIWDQVVRPGCERCVCVGTGGRHAGRPGRCVNEHEDEEVDESGEGQGGCVFLLGERGGIHFSESIWRRRVTGRMQGMARDTQKAWKERVSE